MSGWKPWTMLRTRGGLVRHIDQLPASFAGQIEGHRERQCHCGNDSLGSSKQLGSLTLPEEKVEAGPSGYNVFLFRD